MKDSVIVAIALIGIMACLAILAHDDYDEAVAQQEMYCFMVKRYQQSEGAYGWPDYKGTYEKHCKRGEIVNDIVDVLARIRVEFKAANLEPPSAILLRSHEEGTRFLSAMRQTSQWVAIVGSPDLGHPVEMADGSVWMEMKVMGISVRWPANRTATPDGSWSYT